MLLQIASFLLDVVLGLLGGACLLRLYMQYQRVPFGNPIGRFVFALTDWIVLPLRRVLPPVGRIDSASLVAVYLLELLQYLALWLLMGALGTPAVLLLMAVFGVVRLTISAMTALMIIYAVLSWVRVDSLLAGIVERLSTPLLAPLRRLVPLVGGVDLSPLVLLVLLQIGLMALSQVQAGLLR